MSKSPAGVRYQTGWEDSECASVEELICSCGQGLLEGYDSILASSGKRIKCPNCSREYEFIWVGMELKELASA